MLLSDLSRADTDLLQSGEITINPSSTAPTLTLQGPAFDSASAGNFGLVLSYQDSTSSDPTASSILRIFRPTGQYQWQFSTATGDGRLGMSLGNNHALTLFDPANSSNTIVLQPGTDSSSGVYWNNQRLATISEVSTNFVPLVNGVATVGSSTTPSSLTVYGVTTTPRLNLPATTDLNSGVIYQDGERFLHSYGTDNVFLGHYAGNFGQYSNGTIGGGNVAVGSAALCSLTTGSGNMAIGPGALIANRDGGGNIAIGNALGTMTSNRENIGGRKA